MSGTSHARPSENNIAVFASHGGSDLQAIIDGCAAGKIPARVCVVISNNSDSKALQRARDAGIPAVHLSAKTVGGPATLSEKMSEILRAYKTDIVFLAGYMKKIPDTVLRAYEGRIFNIHPSLLPKFGGRGMFGINVHAAVLAAGETQTGITIHRVTAEYDAGDILAQRTVKVFEGDTPEILAERVLREEHIFLVEFLAGYYRQKEEALQHAELKKKKSKKIALKLGFGIGGGILAFILTFYIGIPACAVMVGRAIDNRRDRERARLLALEDNVFRFERWADWEEFDLAARVDHEVDIEQYRPFRYGNRLTLMQEEPTIVFTENFPRLDGATAAFPVFAAAAQALFYGLDEYTAREFVTVSTTDVAYERLINGEIDIFFGAQPSPAQVAAAREAGVEFTMTPIAREAFVFFVHEYNPVQSLTVQQIRDIYQRNITNWSHFGGRDERILAFQRPEGSGSQTIMQALVMAGLEMAEPVMEEEMGPMGAIIGYITVNEYRNVSSAIGYSFRYFVTGMHPAEGISILAVNGIAPTLENIRNGAYPFIINVYAVTATRPGENDKNAANENTALLLEWILSDQGQRFIELCGIVPIRVVPPIEEVTP